MHRTAVMEPNPMPVYSEGSPIRVGETCFWVSEERIVAFSFDYNGAFLWVDMPRIVIPLIEFHDTNQFEVVGWHPLGLAVVDWHFVRFHLPSSVWFRMIWDSDLRFKNWTWRWFAGGGRSGWKQQTLMPLWSEYSERNWRILIIASFPCPLYLAKLRDLWIWNENSRGPLIWYLFLSICNWAKLSNPEPAMSVNKFMLQRRGV